MTSQNLRKREKAPDSGQLIPTESPKLCTPGSIPSRRKWYHQDGGERGPCRSVEPAKGITDSLELNQEDGLSLAAQETPHSTILADTLAFEFVNQQLLAVKCLPQSTGLK